MKKAILLTAALCVLTAGAALASGSNLSWDDCAAPGQLNKTSTCLTNTGTAGKLFASWALPAPGATDLVGNEWVLDVITNAATLPCWWNFTAAPRNTSGARDVVYNDACVSATDWYALSTSGALSGGLGAFLMPNASTPRVRLKGAAAISADDAMPWPPEEETYSFTFLLKNAATVGACNGCNVAACFVLNLVRVTQATQPPFELTSGNPRNFAFWQGGAVAAPGCPLAVPTKNQTWGSVKALYR